MTSATGSQAYIAMVKQDPATPRTIPATPVMQKVNFTDDSLITDITTKESNHIRDDRMLAGLNITGFTVGGGYNFEFQFENSKDDELFPAFLWTEEWSTPIKDLDIEGAIFSGTDELDLSTVGIPPVIIDGQKIQIRGCAEELNNRIYILVSTITPNVYTVTPPFEATEALPAGAVMNGSMIRNGKFYQPFFIERGHLDVSEYFKFLGMACNILNLNFADQSDVLGSYQFVGLTSQVDKTPETGATYLPLTTNPVFSTATNIKSVMIDGVPQEGCFVKEMDLVLDNKVTPKTGLGVLGACETKAHRLSASGKITMFFEDSAMYKRLLNGTPFRLDIDVLDVNGKGYSFAVPRAQLDTDKINVTGVDDDVLDNASFVGTADPVTNCMVQVDRFAPNTP